MSNPCPKCGRSFVWDGKRCCRQDCRYGSDVAPLKPSLDGACSWGTYSKLGISDLSFEYDPMRGGFILHLGPCQSGHAKAVIGGLIVARLDERGLVAGVKSFWDYGGLPLRGIHRTESFPSGEFSVEGNELRVGPILLRQTRENLEMWFSTGDNLPRTHWTSQHDAETGITVWFSRRKAQSGWPVPGTGTHAECHLVAGLRVALNKAAIRFPVSSLTLSTGDFK